MHCNLHDCVPKGSQSEKNCGDSLEGQGRSVKRGSASGSRDKGGGNFTKAGGCYRIVLGRVAPTNKFGCEKNAVDNLVSKVISYLGTTTQGLEGGRMQGKGAGKATDLAACLGEGEAGWARARGAHVHGKEVGGGRGVDRNENRVAGEGGRRLGGWWPKQRRVRAGEGAAGFQQGPRDQISEVGRTKQGQRLGSSCGKNI
ncbi:hypothetical protein HNY73_011730 [Argiope bruennichi]|uniref:Uncharacterized protein n=1 Tax=Argiope bruennichi TaxID=94029 RepID=A0A8T0F3N8_ARGBR|nr:hypothetical protein HNY73_011730 [Argiope bruennichi]